MLATGWLLHLDRSMIAPCRPTPNIDGTQLANRHLHRLMIVQSRSCTVKLSASPGAILKMNSTEPLVLRFFLNPLGKLRSNVVGTLKLVPYFSRDLVPSKFKIKNIGGNITYHNISSELFSTLLSSLMTMPITQVSICSMKILFMRTYIISVG